MRLITHNLLQCHVRSCTSNNFPLQFQDVELDMNAPNTETEFNASFLTRFLPKLDWPALYRTALELGLDGVIPEQIPQQVEGNEEFLQGLHKVLFEVHIQSGSMKCRNCQRTYPITNGIPNMLLQEDEV